MKALIDTDAFCKLACSGLLTAALKELGAVAADARRLPALHHMLRRGKLVRTLGQARATVALKAALEMDVVPDAGAQWLQEILDAAAEIDAGEAQLLAVAAANPGILLISGDKRALRELVRVPKLAQTLPGRIVTVEAILIALCDSLGEPVVRAAVTPIYDLDATVKACFASSDSKKGLQSYQTHLAGEVPAGLFWAPP